ncbi:hypothetical protein [Actinopolymorpha pittospori]|uniref:Uncharacterized protein n=1 Tax=Actinopolymorpha pittospori TaxID=648752 RepID=A0A927MMN4_9ACTN|nr:hypothetical protein [Actinopolymorpha pittospori]MBE1603486.1 hypothetical protein [Actinopolymorpha pittospori]
MRAEHVAGTLFAARHTGEALGRLAHLAAELAQHLPPFAET